MDRIEWWLKCVEAELRRAKEKHPGSFHNGHEGYAVLLEEVDELWDNVKADKRWESIEEAVQVAAMALRFLVDLGSPDVYRAHLRTLALLKDNAFVPEPFEADADAT